MATISYQGVDFEVETAVRPDGTRVFDAATGESLAGEAAPQLLAVSTAHRRAAHARREDGTWAGVPAYRDDAHVWHHVDNESLHRATSDRRVYSVVVDVRWAPLPGYEV